MGTVEIICSGCKNKSTYDAIYVSEKGLPEICPNCGKKYNKNSV